MTSFEFPGQYYEIIRADFRNLDAETTFLASYAPEGGRVLDIGCGTGSNLHALQQMGYRCTGIDQSAQFIDYAREQVPGTNFIQTRADQYQAEEKFDLIFSLFVTLNYLSRPELHRVLDNVARMLAPGGVFVADIGHMLNFADRYQPYIIAHHRRDDILITRMTRHAIDPHQANWRHDETILVRDGDRPIAMYDNSFDQMVLTAPELTHYLHDAGMSVSETYGSFSKDPAPANGWGHLILVAQSNTAAP